MSAAARVRATATRIAAMSADEIRTRAGMLLRQRLDAWQARRGIDPLAVPYQDTERGKFFFDPHAVPALAAEVIQHLPQEAESVIESARRVAAGSFDLLGYEALSFRDGQKEIDWHLDPVHGIRAPYVPWFRVPYLDFQKTGDHKIVWELSRHQHLMLLARAWLYSGDLQFLRRLENLWRDWSKSNPYPIGINWASALEVAFRCLSWIWVDHFTAGAALLSKDVREGIRNGIGRSALYIQRYLSTYFAPNTHLLGEALTLFFAGVLYPGFAKAESWRERGWAIILQEARRQVLPDGFHFEQSVYYHVYALDMFLHARILAMRNSIPVPGEFDAVLISMAEGLASISAGGEAPRFGDDDGGRLFDGRRNRAAHLLDPLATASMMYRRGDWKSLAGGMHEESLWLLGRKGAAVFNSVAVEAPCPRTRFPNSGYYLLRSEYGVAIIDAGPHGWGRGGHGHADALSIQAITSGRGWLTDPGTCVYPKEKSERDLFRGTGAHNTLEVDGLSQAEPVHSFAWQRHPATAVHLWHESKRVTIFHGSHDGYRRLADPVTHHRWIIGWPAGLWLVRDVAIGEGTHCLNLHWHLAPKCSYGVDGAWHMADSNNTLAISIAADTNWRVSDEVAPWSPAYGAATTAPMVKASYDGRVPAECGTLLAWNRANSCLVQRKAPAACAYFRSCGDVHHIAVFSTASGGWRFGEMESDAELLGMEISAGIVTHLFEVRGPAVSEWCIGEGDPAPIHSDVIASLVDQITLSSKQD